MQKIETTDAYVLMQFVRDTAHLKDRRVDDAVRAEMLRIGTPVKRQLELNGHAPFDAIDLMRRAFYG